MRIFQITCYFSFVLLLTCSIAGCGRPKNHRPLAEIKAEVFPVLVGEWSLDRDLTTEAISNSPNGTALIKAMIPAAQMDVKFTRGREFRCQHVMGELEAKYIGAYDVESSGIVMKQTHRIEPPIIPGALETSVPDKSRIMLKLKDEKLYLTHKLGGVTPVPYVLKKIK